MYHVIPLHSYDHIYKVSKFQLSKRGDLTNATAEMKSDTEQKDETGAAVQS